MAPASTRGFLPLSCPVGWQLPLAVKPLWKETPGSLCNVFSYFERQGHCRAGTSVAALPGLVFLILPEAQQPFGAHPFSLLCMCNPKPTHLRVTENARLSGLPTTECPCYCVYECVCKYTCTCAQMHMEVKGPQRWFLWYYSSLFI